MFKLIPDEKNLSMITLSRIQSPLDFATLDKAAALDLATSKAVTDLRQYINSDLGFSDLKMCFFI